MISGKSQSIHIILMAKKTSLCSIQEPNSHSDIFLYLFQKDTIMSPQKKGVWFKLGLRFSVIFKQNNP